LKSKKAKLITANSKNVDLIMFHGDGAIVEQLQANCFHKKQINSNPKTSFFSIFVIIEKIKDGTNEQVYPL